MGRQREHGGSLRPGGATPGQFRIDSGSAELIRDRDNPNAYLLMVNGVESSHIDLADPTWLEFEYIRWIATVIEHQVPPGSPLLVLHLGAAACSLARYLIAVRPSSAHLAVDTDGELSRLVRIWFDLPRAPALRIRIGDARAVTEALPDAGYQVVVRDAFAGAVTPPALTTMEFTAQVHRVLEPGGLYILNCADTPDMRLARAEAATVGAVFGQLAMLADPPMLKGRRRGNVLVVGSDRPLDSAGLARELLGGALPAQWWGDDRSRRFAASGQPLVDGE